MAFVILIGAAISIEITRRLGGLLRSTHLTTKATGKTEGVIEENGKWTKVIKVFNHQAEAEEASIEQMMNSLRLLIPQTDIPIS